MTARSWGEPTTNRSDNLGLLIDDDQPVPGQPPAEGKSGGLG